MPQMSPLNWVSIFMAVLLLIFFAMLWWNFYYSYVVQEKFLKLTVSFKKWVW